MLYTYDDILKYHALGCLEKPAEIPNDRLYVGDLEKSESVINIQLLANSAQPVARALIEPQLENSVENIGLVGDEQGIVSQADFYNGQAYLGSPIESEV